MKKIFTFALALMGLATVANAATIDDVQVCQHSYVLCFDDWDGAGTAKPGKGQLFGNGYFLDVTGGSVATNKGKVNLSVLNEADDNHVTQYIVDKYGADYPNDHLNSWRLKNAQDVIAMKVTAKSKLIFFLQGNNKSGKDARIPKISQNADLSDALNPAPDENHPATDAGFRYEWIAPDDMTIYIGTYNGDTFFSYLIVEANEAPGTPSVKVGDQTFEDGLWFREVTCKANPATEEGSSEMIPTIVTYTTDGTAPTAASEVYSGPIKCYKDQTVKFQAYLDIMGGLADEEFKCEGADNEANVNFQFNAPTINADGADVTIVSEYPGDVKNFYALNDGEAVQGDAVTLTESATVTAYSEIKNGDYTTFTTNSTSKDVYVLNPIKEKKVIEVIAGEVVVDEEATANDQNGNTIYRIEGGAISADSKDFFVKNLTLKVEKDAQYQVPEGREMYIQMSNTNITFQVAEGDSVNVKVVTTKNSCKTLNPENDESITTDRKNYVNVSGTNYGHDDVTEEGGNIIEFGLTAGTYTFQKYSGTGNIIISSIEIAPANENPETIEGDVNADGEVDVADISSILTVMAGDTSKFTEEQADVNGDGKPDVADISTVLTIMAGGKTEEEPAASRATRADNEVSVLSAANVIPAEDGTFDLVINMDYETSETLVGWNFSLTLPEGVDFNTTKTTAAARKKCCDFGELIDEDVASEGLTIQERPAGGYLFNWIDQGDKTPLLGTKGRLISINLKADPASLSGTGKIFGIGLSNNKDQGFATFGGGATIADVEFAINGGDSDGIQDIQAAGNKSAVYNLSGQRVNGQAKGLLIQDGKKFIVK